MARATVVDTIAYNRLLEGLLAGMTWQRAISHSGLNANTYNSWAKLPANREAVDRLYDAANSQVLSRGAALNRDLTSQDSAERLAAIDRYDRRIAQQERTAQREAELRQTKVLRDAAAAEHKAKADWYAAQAEDIRNGGNTDTDTDITTDMPEEGFIL